MELDLDAIRAIIDGYEARKKNAREWHIKNDVPADEDHLSRLASFRTDEAVKAFEALRPLVERVRELEIVEESLARNLADTAFCPLCLLEDCPQYGKGDLGMGAFEPESVDREQCKKSILAHARKYAKEFAHGQRTA